MGFGERLGREKGQETIWCLPRNTGAPDKGHRKYPYLLGSLEVKRPDQVWCADITYVPMWCGHAYLCVVMDWVSRKVLGWRLSNTMEVGLCLEALAMAVRQAGRLPEVFNTAKAASSPARNGPGNSLGLESPSAWMGRGAGWTTCSSNGSGAA